MYSNHKIHTYFECCLYFEWKNERADSIARAEHSYILCKQGESFFKARQGEETDIATARAFTALLVPEPTLHCGK